MLFGRWLISRSGATPFGTILMAPSSSGVSLGLGLGIKQKGLHLPSNVLHSITRLQPFLRISSLHRHSCIFGAYEFTQRCRPNDLFLLLIFLQT